MIDRVASCRLAVDAMLSKPLQVDEAILRRLAVAADVDPRSLKKILAGKTVRGMAGRRAALVLRQAGLLGDSGPVDALTAKRHPVNPSGSQNKP
jgi:hypothetical protein